MFDGMKGIEWKSDVCNYTLSTIIVTGEDFSQLISNERRRKSGNSGASLILIAQKLKEIRVLKL